MPKKDELAERRYRNLVDHLEGLMRAALKPEYEGYYGQLILNSGELAELGELGDVRRAARAAGQHLGWQPATKLVGGRLFVLDTREAPAEIARLAEDQTSEAMDRAFRQEP
ncbi:hypothetical protein [Streptomyces sp. B15]|uniref:hypothetical protein n=1 Tax=Streptomyces sp. B15 TaxID=1537797 RepID=UPI001615D509|nr:hypothetical protein [Streptomyces sp. B15]MBQ1120509.1 hypothetical protein [Streptomyces sp. B15]